MDLGEKRLGNEQNTCLNVSGVRRLVSLLLPDFGRIGNRIILGAQKGQGILGVYTYIRWSVFIFSPSFFFLPNFI